MKNDDPKDPDQHDDQKEIDRKDDDLKNDRKANARQIDERKFRLISRREVLKLTPVLALGAFAIPKLQEGMLKKGLGFSDWAQAHLPLRPSGDHFRQ